LRFILNLHGCLSQVFLERLDLQLTFARTHRNIIYFSNKNAIIDFFLSL
jgi:hypothetical protein